MQTVVVETWIAAPPERCFDLARDLDLHVKSIPGSDERAVAGRMTGLIELDEEVTWRARHFGITQELTSRLTAFDRPHHFQDAMQRGAFKSFVHDHFFTLRDGGTNMVDHLVFAAPIPLLGRIAEVCVLKQYLRRLLAARARIIKAAAEVQ